MSAEQRPDMEGAIAHYEQVVASSDFSDPVFQATHFDYDPDGTALHGAGIDSEAAHQAYVEKAEEMKEIADLVSKLNGCRAVMAMDRVLQGRSDQTQLPAELAFRAVELLQARPHLNRIGIRHQEMAVATVLKLKHPDHEKYFPVVK